MPCGTGRRIPTSRVPDPPEYYEKAYERLSDLAYYCLEGESPYLSGTGFEPM